VRVFASTLFNHAWVICCSVTSTINAIVNLDKKLFVRVGYVRLTLENHNLAFICRFFTVFFFFLTTLIAALIGITLVMIIAPGRSLATVTAIVGPI
jgi:hypothetical protein